MGVDKLDPVTIRFYDTKAQALRDFVPLVDGRAGIYVCGPTVQSSPHIGHLRSALVYDIWRRWLTYRGFTVTLVRNVTTSTTRSSRTLRRAQRTVAKSGGRSPTGTNSSSRTGTGGSASLLQRTSRAPPRESPRCRRSSRGSSRAVTRIQQPTNW